jgi:hypothetical protein
MSPSPIPRRGVNAIPSRYLQTSRYDILLCMTPLLEEAIETLRELPEDEQDAAADAVFVYISRDERHCVPIGGSPTSSLRIHRGRV